MIYDLTTNEIIEGYVRVYQNENPYHTNMNSNSPTIVVKMSDSYYGYAMEWFAHSSSGLFAKKRELFLPNQSIILHGCLLARIDNLSEEEGFITIEILSDHYMNGSFEELHSQFKSAKRDKKINEILG